MLIRASPIAPGAVLRSNMSRSVEVFWIAFQPGAEKVSGLNTDLERRGFVRA